MAVLNTFNALTLSLFESFLQTNHNISTDLTGTYMLMCSCTDTAA